MIDWLRNVYFNFWFRAKLYSYYIKGLLKTEPEKVMRSYDIED